MKYISHIILILLKYELYFLFISGGERGKEKLGRMCRVGLPTTNIKILIDGR